MYSEQDFTRERKLSPERVIGHLLLRAAQRNSNGIAITSREYFDDLNEILGSHLQCVSRSSFSEARAKLSFGAIKYLLRKNNFEQKNRHADKWKGHFVEAIDGTQLSLPTNKEVLAEFPRRPGRYAGYYPKTMLVTALNVFTGQPIAMSMASYKVHEQSLLRGLLDELPTGCICLLDRGYSGEPLGKAIHERGSYFITRECAQGKKGRVPLLVKQLFASGRSEMTGPLCDRKESLVVRAIKFRSRDHYGDPIVIVTNLLNQKRYPRKEVIALYKRRWEAESLYMRMKEILWIENFSARSVNGIKQEIYAHLLLLSFTASLIREAMGVSFLSTTEQMKVPSFKNALESVRRWIPELTGIKLSSRYRKRLLLKILKAIKAVVHCRQPGRKLPRISMQSTPKWNTNRGRGAHNRPRTLSAKQHVERIKQAKPS